MSFFITPTVTEIDRITDEATLIKSMPETMGPRFQAVKELRQAHEDLAVYTNHGRIMGGENYKRVASIPAPLLAAALCLEPDLLTNKKKFYAWLDRHPGYQAYDRRKHAAVS